MTVQLETRLKEFMLSLAFDVGEELLVLVGRAGSGKSIVLRSIAGVYQPDAGSITIRDRVVFSSGLHVNLLPPERHVGFVTQSNALFPHLNVADNVAFPLRKYGGARVDDIDRRVDEIIELLGLGPLRTRIPADLSELDQHRVALARALVTDPEVLLMDDPFARMDVPTRREARTQLVELRRQIGVPAIFSTGEMNEAHDLDGRAALIDRGKLLQIDTPARLMTRPVSRAVAEIVRSTNVFAGEVIREDDESTEVRTQLGVFEVVGPGGLRGPVDVVIRPEHVRVLRPDETHKALANVLNGTISRHALDGATHLVTFTPTSAPPGTELQMLLPDLAFQQAGIFEGQRCVVVLPPERLHLMPRLPDYITSPGA